MNTIRGAIWTALLVACVVEPAGAQTCAAEPVGAQTCLAEVLTATLEESVPRWLAETGEPGVAIVVMDACQPAFMGTWGRAEGAAAGLPVKASTLFNVGSISKTLTAWGVMRLAEAGAIDLDAPVGRYLVRWRPDGDGFDADGVTVRRLLSHTAGINVPSVSGVDPHAPLPSLLDELERGRPEIGIEPVRIAIEPGSTFDYSGGGYMILQALIEDVTDRPFADWMAAEVLRPLGMIDSSFGLDPEIEEKAATPHAIDGSTYARRRFPALAAAGLWSTIDDMATFLTAHCASPDGGRAGRGVISPAALTAMWSPVAPAGRYGLGYEVPPPLGDQPVVAHSGSNFGWKADFIVLPGLGLGIAVLTNVDEGRTRMAALGAFRDAVVAAERPEGVSRPEDRITPCHPPGED